MSHPIQEEDKIPIGKIVVVAIVALAVFGVGAVWAVAIQRSEQHSIVQEHHSNGPDVAGSPEVGIVYQTPFTSARYADDKKDEKEAWLTHYGWVDKAKGTVHVPIDQAMRKYVSQQSSSGGSK